MALAQITQWIQDKYPKPKLDPEWATACIDFLQNELQLDPVTKLAELKHHVHLQLLQSDLGDSMIRETGFHARLAVPGGMKKGIIGTRASGGAILVQIVGIMEVGNSAFTLSNVRQARLDKADMTGLTRDHEEPGEGEEGGGQTNDVEEEEDATMPPYPRSMLTLLLSDGTVTIKAMEIKRLPNIILGETSLGFKILLKGVPVRNGIAMLEPDNVELLGYQNDELQSHADFKFMNALRKRMGKPEIEQEGEQQEPLNPVVEAPVPPPSPPPPQVPRPAREEPRGDISDYFDEFTPPPEDFANIRLSPPAQTTNPTAGTQRPPPRKNVIECSPDLEESFRNEISMDMDDDFWKEMDEFEEMAIPVPKSSSTASKAVKSAGTTQTGGKNSGSSGRVKAPAPEIIELDDSDEEMEEVQTRLKRVQKSRVIDTIDLSD